MQEYIKSLQDLSTQLKDTLEEQKQLIDKLKWVVNYFGDIIIEENKKEIEVNIDNEHAEDLKADAGMIAKDLDERDDDLEKLSEEESEVLP
jgi:hypothetical protein